MWWIIGIIVIAIMVIGAIADPDARRLKEIEEKRTREENALINLIKSIVEKNNEIKDKMQKREVETIQQAFSEYSENREKYLNLEIIKPKSNTGYYQVSMTADWINIADEPCPEFDYDHPKTQHHEFRNLSDYKMNPVRDIVKQGALLYAFLDYNENLFYETHDTGKYKTIEKKVGVSDFFNLCSSKHEFFHDMPTELSSTEINKVIQSQAVHDIPGFTDYSEGLSIRVYEDCFFAQPSAGCVLIIDEINAPSKRDDFITL